MGRIDGERLYDASGQPIGRADGLRRTQMTVFFISSCETVAMTVREILKMGDARLLLMAEPVTARPSSGAAHGADQPGRHAAGCDAGRRLGSLPVSPRLAGCGASLVAHTLHRV